MCSTVHILDFIPNTVDNRAVLFSKKTQSNKSPHSKGAFQKFQLNPQTASHVSYLIYKVLLIIFKAKNNDVCMLLTR